MSSDSTAPGAGSDSTTPGAGSDTTTPGAGFDVADPMMASFWRGAEVGELVIQRCSDCGRHQFYPRPFCLSCRSAMVEGVPASGRGTVYSMTTVRAFGNGELDPPYVVAIVELEEGPRLVTNIVDGSCSIGDAVEVVWGRRLGLSVPLFRPSGLSDG